MWICHINLHSMYCLESRKTDYREFKECFQGRPRAIIVYKNCAHELSLQGCI